MSEPLSKRISRFGWACADVVVHIVFAIGVLIFSDLPSAWAAWKWKRAHRVRLGSCSKCGIRGWCVCETCQREQHNRRCE